MKQKKVLLYSAGSKFPKLATTGDWRQYQQAQRGWMSYGQQVHKQTLKALSRGLPYNFPKTTVVDVGGWSAKCGQAYVKSLMSISP